MSKHAFQGKRPIFFPMAQRIEDKLDELDASDLLAVAYNKLRESEQMALDERDANPPEIDVSDVSHFRSASRHVLSALALIDPIVVEVSIKTSEKLERDIAERNARNVDEQLSPMEWFIKNNG